MAEVTDYARGNIVHALTEWDRRQSLRDKHHNRHFLGIALGSLRESEKLGGTPAEIAARAFTGRLLYFVLKAIGEDTETARRITDERR